jgi:hypothetical protein
MASDDRPNLPRVTLRDEKLYVEGEKEPYFRDSEHTIRLRIRELTIRRGYQPDYSDRTAPKVLAERCDGKGGVPLSKLEGFRRRTRDSNRAHARETGLRIATFSTVNLHQIYDRSSIANRRLSVTSTP